MLALRAGARRPEAAWPSTFAAGDAHALAFADRSFDAVVSLRVLMHTPDWRQCLAELCRVARERVVFDYPALVQRGGAAGRRRGALARAAGRARRGVPRVRRRDDRASELEPARVPRASRRTGSSSCRSRCTRRSGRAGSPSGRRGPARGVGLLRLAGVARHRRGGAVRVLVTGATGFTGGHLARTLAAPAATGVRALVRPGATAPRGSASRRGRAIHEPAIELAAGDLTDARVARPRAARRRRRLSTSRRSTGRPACRREPTARSTPRRSRDR